MWLELTNLKSPVVGAAEVHSYAIEERTQERTPRPADEGANIFEVVHHRIGSARSVNLVDLELTLEVRDRAHGEALLEALRAAGYVAEVVQPFRHASRPG